MSLIKIESRPTIKKVEKAIASLFDYEIQKITTKDFVFRLKGISTDWSENTKVQVDVSRSKTDTWLSVTGLCTTETTEQILSQIKNEIEK